MLKHIACKKIFKKISYYVIAQRYAKRKSYVNLLLLLISIQSIILQKVSDLLLLILYKHSKIKGGQFCDHIFTGLL